MNGEIISFLKKVFIFEDLTLPELERVASIVKRRRFETGDYIIEEGEEGDSIFIIISGSVDVTKGSDADELSIASLGPGKVFGEMAIFDTQNRTANVKASESLEIFQIYRDDFFNLLKDNLMISHKILMKIIRFICQRLRDASVDTYLLLIVDDVRTSLSRIQTSKST